jgi:acetyl-CoA acetyltransferase family protein
MACLISGLGESVPAITVNRLCGSGLDAVIIAARMIRDGSADVVLAGGVESMSRAPFVMPKAETAFSRNAEVHDTTIGWRFVHKGIAARYGIASMPETAENLATERGIGRADQDAYALRAQTRFDADWHAADIVPVTPPGKVPLPVGRDEHPRATTAEKLAALPAPFRAGGTVTAGNSSGVNDGAACVLIASAKAVKTFDLIPLARIGHGATAGVAPRIMGIGPVAALERITARTGLSAQDFDVIELNEAFAAQVLACTRAWGLADDAPHVNARGGAIALGHPLGMSGARIAATAARRLAETGGTHALATACIGVGQGIALTLHAV